MQKSKVEYCINVSTLAPLVIVLWRKLMMKYASPHKGNPSQLESVGWDTGTTCFNLSGFHMPRISSNSAFKREL